MNKVTTLALSLFCTIAASQVFAQCAPGSPCAQRNAGYYQESYDTDYDTPSYGNPNYQSNPRYRQDPYRSSNQRPGRSYSQPAYYPDQYSATPGSYSYGNEVADEDTGSSYMSNKPMTSQPSQSNQSSMTPNYSKSTTPDYSQSNYSKSTTPGYSQSNSSMGQGQRMNQGQGTMKQGQSGNDSLNNPFQDSPSNPQYQ